MSYTKASTDDVDPLMDPEYGQMWFLRDALDTRDLGVTILELEPGALGKEHDHSGNDEEEVYVLVEGDEMTLHFDDGDETLGAHEAIRVSPDETRQLENTGEERATLVIVGGPKAD